MNIDLLTSMSLSLLKDRWNVIIRAKTSWKYRNKRNHDCNDSGNKVITCTSSHFKKTESIEVFKQKSGDNAKSETNCDSKESWPKSKIKPPDRLIEGIWTMCCVWKITSFRFCWLNLGITLILILILFWWHRLFDLKALNLLREDSLFLTKGGMWCD